MRARFSDAQCGCKAGRTHEVPVDWVEDTDSRVDVVRAALDDLRGMARVARRRLPARKGVLRP